MAWALSVFCVATLASCSTVKYVDRVRTVTDSSVIQQNEQLQKLYATTVARYEKQLQDSSGVRVEFITDTMQLPGTVIIDRAGVLQAQGRIKSVQLSNTQLLRERGELSRMVDSLTAVKQKTEVRVETKTVTVEKKVKRGWPWLWLVLGIVAGWIARGHWPRVRKWVGFVAVLLICPNAGAQVKIDTAPSIIYFGDTSGHSFLAGAQSRVPEKYSTPLAYPCDIKRDTTKCFLLVSKIGKDSLYTIKGYLETRVQEGFCFNDEKFGPVYLDDKKRLVKTSIIVWQHKQQNW